MYVEIKFMLFDDKLNIIKHNIYHHLNTEYTLISMAPE